MRHKIMGIVPGAGGDALYGVSKGCVWIGGLLHKRTRQQTAEKTQAISKMRRRAAKKFSEEEIAMKTYLTPEMKIVKLELSDIITDSTKGETPVADTVISGSGSFWTPGQGGGGLNEE